MGQDARHAAERLAGRSSPSRRASPRAPAAGGGTRCAGASRTGGSGRRSPPGPFAPEQRVPRHGGELAHARAPSRSAGAAASGHAAQQGADLVQRAGVEHRLQPRLDPRVDLGGRRHQRHAARPGRQGGRRPRHRPARRAASGRSPRPPRARAAAAAGRSGCSRAGHRRIARSKPRMELAPAGTPGGPGAQLRAQLRRDLGHRGHAVQEGVQVEAGAADDDRRPPLARGLRRGPARPAPASGRPRAARRRPSTP